MKYLIKRKKGKNLTITDNNWLSVKELEKIAATSINEMIVEFNTPYRYGAIRNGKKIGMFFKDYDIPKDVDAVYDLNNGTWCEVIVSNAWESDQNFLTIYTENRVYTQAHNTGEWGYLEVGGYAHVGGEYTLENHLQNRKECEKNRTSLFLFERNNKYSVNLINTITVAEYRAFEREYWEQN